MARAGKSCQAVASDEKRSHIVAARVVFPPKSVKELHCGYLFHAMGEAVPTESANYAHERAIAKESYSLHVRTYYSQGGAKSLLFNFP